MELAPIVTDGSFVSFWSTPAAWGRFDLGAGELAVSAVAGSLSLKQVETSASLRAGDGKFLVTCGDKEVDSSVTQREGRTSLRFSAAISVTPNNPLRVRARG